MPATLRRPTAPASPRATVALAFLAGLALSPRLWLSAGREYPLTPVAGWLPSAPSPLDAIWIAALALALVVVAATRRARAPVVAALVLAGGLALLDQSRWQPWAYQYFLMLAAIAVAGGRPSRADEDARGGGGGLAGEPALATAGLIVAAIYLWSGLSKAGAVFGEDVYPELLEPFFGGPLPGVLAAGAYAVPMVEATIGVGLLRARGRPYAIVAAGGMHASSSRC